MTDSIEPQLLQRLGQGDIADTGDFAKELNVDHNALVGVLKSLLAHEMITTQVGGGRRWGGPRYGLCARSVLAM